MFLNTLVCWKPLREGPSETHICVTIKGNPGMIGCVGDYRGNTIAIFVDIIGKGTINKLEMKALIKPYLKLRIMNFEMEGALKLLSI